MDVIFIHCPSYYDFRKQLLITSTYTDGITNSSVFEMYPMGLLSMTATLQRYGYKARIINLANRMVNDEKLDVEKLIQRLDAPIFGFDLHWMIHSHGVMAISKLVKEYHPNAKIILGGFTSSYFGKEILATQPQIDMVLRGDTVELLLVKLVHLIESNQSMDELPNLLWRDKNGHIKENLYSHVPKEFDHTNEDFLLHLIKMIIDSRDLNPLNFMPNAFYPKKVGLPILFCKGCTQNCTNCGASAYANKKVLNREKVALKNPILLASEIVNMYNSYGFSMRAFGDFRVAGKKYVSNLINYIKRFTGGKRIDVPMVMELFWPADEEYLNDLKSIFSNISFECSPETGNDEIRIKQGRLYSNENLLKFTQKAVEKEITNVVYWFQIGNGFETKESLIDTQRLAQDLLKIDNKVTQPFISPLCPYIDPGSIAFENPEQSGYTLLYRNLTEQLKGFEYPIWKYYLNYETLYFNRDELVEEAYKQAIILNDVKTELGAMHEQERLNSNAILQFSHRLMNAVEHRIKSGSDIRTSSNIFTNFNTMSTIKMKVEHTNYFFKAQNPLLMLQNGIRFATWRLKHILDYQKLFYRNGKLNLKKI